MTTDTSYITEIFEEKDPKLRLDRAMELDPDWPFDWDMHIITYLLNQDEIFINASHEDPTVFKMFVPLSDFFSRCCADLEQFSHKDLGDMWAFYSKNQKWGLFQWSMKSRNYQPIIAQQDAMKKDGAWEDWMDGIEVNTNV